MTPDPAPARNLSPRFIALFRLRLFFLFAALGSYLIVVANVVDITGGIVLFGGSVLAYSIISLALWRCPVCHKYPGNAVMPDLCERCGATLFGLDAHLPPVEPHPIGHGRTIKPIIAARAALGVLVFAFFAVAGGLNLLSPAIFWGVSLVVLAGSAWFEWRWWRCPNCGGYLKRSFWPGRTCSKCGHALL